MQARQGDVFVQSVRTHKNLVGKDFKEAAKEGGRTVLAHGEVTGHAHALPGDLAHLFIPTKLSREEPRLRVVKPAVLFHEEHHQPSTGHVVQLPAGDYEVIRQREYSPEEIRNVAD